MSKYTQKLQQETAGLQVALASQKAKKEILKAKKNTIKARMQDLSLSEHAHDTACRVYAKTSNQYGEVIKQISKLETAIEKRMDLLEQLEQA